MKKIVYFIGLLLLVWGCNNPQGVEEILGDDPDSRISDTLGYLRSTLIEAPNGWKAHLTTEYAGAYAFYMEFGDNDRLKMVADLNAETSSQIKESTYRVRQIMAATLSFDTYNYITMLQDPDPSVFGGNPGRGLGSDVEYNYIRTSGDTLVFEGRKFNKQQLILVKANAEEATLYTEGKYKEAIEQTIDFFSQNANPYIEVDGARYQITASIIGKLTNGTVVLAGNEVVSNTSKFYFSLEGFKTASPLPIGAKQVSEFRRQDGKLFAISNDQEEYEVKNAMEPLVPLHLLMGTKHMFLFSPFKTYFPGTSQQGLDILAYFHDGLGNGATGYIFNYGELDLMFEPVNQRITLTGFSSQNGGNSGWATAIGYDYTLDNTTGIYTLTQRSAASGGYTSAILQPLHDFLINSRFALSYYTEAGVTYGRITGIERPEVVITFELL